MAMIKKHKQTLLSALQRVFCFILAAIILGAVGVPSAVLALDNSAPTVEIVGFMRGDSKDLRSSELLMAKLSNYSGNPEKLTYEWENKLGTYLYVFDKHDMAVVRGTKSEIEIYNTDKNVSPSKNMAGRTHNKTYSKKRFAYAAVYGAGVSSEKLKGGISVKVKDSYGNIIATASYTDDFKDYDLSKDMANAVFGVFEGETVDILNLLGQSSVVHVVCPACYVSQGKIISGSDCISLEKSPNGYSIRGLKAGEGVITIKLEKKNCKFHMDSENSSTTTVKVFKKPDTSTTATTLTLTNLDDRCEYYIGGVKGEVSDGKIVFTNLTPSTEYTVEVRGNYIDDDGVPKTAYAYVKDTTKNSYSASVVFKLDDSIADTETIFGNAFEVAVKSDDDYILLQSSENGYTAELTKGNYKVYLKDGNSYKQIEDVVLCVDENNNSAEIKYYSVLYDLNGGTLNEDSEYIYREGASVTTIASKPTKYEYVFDGWQCGDDTFTENQIITESINRKYELSALWEVDKIGDGENPDGIPDKYQKKVTFKVVNGTWEDKTNKDISFYVTLLDDNGKWSVNGSARINIPTGMIANYGYENGKWDIEPKSPVKGTNAETFTYAFSKKTDPKVDYKEPKENDKPTPTTQVVEYGKKIQVKPNGGIWVHDNKTYSGSDVATFVLEKNIKLDDPTRTNYVFMGWDKKEGTGDIAYIFTAIWEVDKIGDGENPDGIPDKYQKKVTFKVVNGTWEDKTNKDISFYVTLLDDNGKWSVNGSARINIPTGMIANYGYENGKWDNEPKSPVKGTNAETFTYAFSKKTDPKVDYKEPKENDKPTPTTQVVEYGKKIQVKPNGGIWVHDNKTYSGSDIATFVLEKNIKLDDPTRSNYVFMGWDKKKGTGDIAYIFTALWEVNKIGDGENPDGIPDKYQKKVTFKVVNGTWEDKTNKDISFYVTLLDDNGKWSVNGSARINIPTGMIANYGYENGKWDNEPKSPVKGTNAETFTYAFSKKTDPKVDYKEPKENDKPTPTTQVVEYGKKIQVKPNGGVWTHDGKTYKGEDVATFVLEKNIKLDDPTRINYVFMGWDKKKGTGDIAYIFTALWKVDKIGDGENPDGIPDKYQKKVTFKVVNGTWEDKTNKDISFYVTLLDDNGKWSVNGSARINIPTGMIANYGYENGKWDIEPTQTVSGTEEVIYVYSFEKIAETKPQPTTSQPTPTVETVVQEKTVYKTQYVEPITLKTGENLTFLGVLSGLCALGFAGTIIFAKKRSK